MLLAQTRLSYTGRIGEEHEPAVDGRRHRPDDNNKVISADPYGDVNGPTACNPVVFGASAALPLHYQRASNFMSRLELF